MPSQLQLLTQMLPVLDSLLENAQSLNEIAKLASSETELVPYQNRQHEIIRELSELDRLLQASPTGASQEKVDAVRKQVRDKLLAFQKINDEFLSHVSAHFRLIHQKDLPLDSIRDHTQ